MLNSAQHEICPANKSKITNNFISFLAVIAEHEKFSASKYENDKYCSYVLAENNSFSAELSIKNVL